MNKMKALEGDFKKARREFTEALRTLNVEHKKRIGLAYYKARIATFVIGYLPAIAYSETPLWALKPNALPENHPIKKLYAEAHFRAKLVMIAKEDGLPAATLYKLTFGGAQ